MNVFSAVKSRLRPDPRFSTQFSTQFTTRFSRFCLHGDNARQPLLFLDIFLDAALRSDLCTLYGIITTEPNRAGTEPERGNPVAYVVYREHIIISTARYDDMSRQWKLKACAIWQGNGTERVKFFDNSPEIFSRFEDAEAAGVEYSKDWVMTRQVKLSRT